MHDHIDVITGETIDAAIGIHKDLGPGLLESVYQILLASELETRGYTVERNKWVPIEYKGLRFTRGFRIDLLVNGIVVVELKSVEKLAQSHRKQVLTYLKLLDLPVGLLINFGETLLRDGLHRIVNGYKPSAPSRRRVRPFVPVESDEV